MRREPVEHSQDFYTDLPVGEILRRARVAAGLSIAEAERILHIRAEYLQSLENSDFDALPGRVYVIGFIRTYAELLNLDGGRVISLLKRQTDGLGTPQALNMHMLPTDSRLPHVSIVAIVFVVIILVAVSWMTYQNARLGGGDGGGQIPPVPETAAPGDVLDRIIAAPAPIVEPAAPVAVNPVSAVEQAPSSPIDNVLADVAAIEPSPESAPVAVVPSPVEPVPAANVVINVIDDTWMEIRTPEGKVLEAREFRRGENVPIAHPVDEFGNPFTITVGNAAGVNITIDGKTIKGLGGKDKVRRNVSLDPKALKPLISPE